MDNIAGAINTVGQAGLDQLKRADLRKVGHKFHKNILKPLRTSIKSGQVERFFAKAGKAIPKLGSKYVAGLGYVLIGTEVLTTGELKPSNLFYGAAIYGSTKGGGYGAAAGVLLFATDVVIYTDSGKFIGDYIDEWWNGL